MICTCIQNRSLQEILQIVDRVEMAEIRLDRGIAGGDASTGRALQREKGDVVGVVLLATERDLREEP